MPKSTEVLFNELAEASNVGDYLQQNLNGPRLYECIGNNGLHDIKIDGRELIEILKMCDVISIY